MGRDKPPIAGRPAGGRPPAPPLGKPPGKPKTQSSKSPRKLKTKLNVGTNEPQAQYVVMPAAASGNVENPHRGHAVEDHSTPDDCSTFFIYPPESHETHSEIEETSDLCLEDVRYLIEELADGGVDIATNIPGPAVAWVEDHYDDAPLVSLRNSGIEGPIASMMSFHQPTLVIFGSILDDQTLDAARNLAIESGYPVMIRPVAASPISGWNSQGDEPEVPGDFDDESAFDRVFEDPVETPELSSEEEGDMEVGDDEAAAGDETEDIDPATPGQRFRPRGGASGSDLRTPWKSQLHDIKFDLQIHIPQNANTNVTLHTTIQFTSQPMYRGLHDRTPQPQLIARVNFSVIPRSTRDIEPDRSYSYICFLIEGRDIVECRALPSPEFTRPRYKEKFVKGATTTRGVSLTAAYPYPSGGLNFSRAENDIHEVQNEDATPQCSVEYCPGNQGKLKDHEISLDSFHVAYEPGQDLTSTGKLRRKYPMEVQFSMGIRVDDPADLNNQGPPPDASFLLRHQTNLWIANKSLKAGGLGMVVLTTAYMPTVMTESRCSVKEFQNLHLSNIGLSDVSATDTTVQQPLVKTAFATGVAPRSVGKLKTAVRKLLSASPFSGREQVDPQPLHLHEFIARGWDITQQEWKMPIYPRLTMDLRSATESRSTAAWYAVVEDRSAPAQGKGKTRDTGVGAPGTVLRNVDAAGREQASLKDKQRAGSSTTGLPKPTKDLQNESTALHAWVPRAQEGTTSK